VIFFWAAFAYFFSYSSLTFGSEAFPQLDNVFFVEEYVEEEVPPPLPVETVFKSYSRLGVFALSGFHRIDSMDTNTGGKALFLSEPSWGFLGNWEQLWFERWSTGVNIAIQNVKMSKPQVGALDERNHKFAQMEVYSSWDYNNWGALKFQVGQATRLISRALSAGSVTLDSVDQTYGGLGLAFNLLNKDKLKLDLLSGYNLYLASDTYRYNIKKSKELLIGTRISHDLDNNILELEIEYKNMDQDLGIARQKSKALTSRFGFIFKIGK
jgi:hypothetical protein